MERFNIEMPDGFQENNSEKEKRTFVYIDHSVPEEPVVVFEYSGKTIIEADEAYNKYTGKDITEQQHIGVAVENE